MRKGFRASTEFPTMVHSTVIGNLCLTILISQMRFVAISSLAHLRLHRAIERQGARIDKARGIVNDVDRNAIGTVGNLRYLLSLFLRIIVVIFENSDDRLDMMA